MLFLFIRRKWVEIVVIHSTKWFEQKMERSRNILIHIFKLLNNSEEMEDMIATKKGTLMEMNILLNELLNSTSFEI